MATKEFKAVFSSPHGGTEILGPARTTLEEALKDRPERSEESHAYLTGVVTRDTTPWTAVPLAAIMEEYKK